MNCLIGIDGGGFGTRAVSVDAAGNVLAFQNGPASNIQHISQEKFAEIIRFILQNLHDAAGTDSVSVQYLTAGFAGVGFKYESEIALSVFHRLGYENKCTIMSDMEIALEGAFPDEPGIVLNSGTGSIAIGRSSSGNIERCGGWGYLLGDEGSGYWIGRSAISTALHSFDTIALDTQLTEIICERFEIDSMPEIIPKVYSGVINRTDIASLAPAVIDAAIAGDIIAWLICNEAAQKLALLVRTVMKKLNIGKPVKLCLTGSVLKRKELFLPLIMDELDGDITFAEPEFPPVIGAVILAMRKCGLDVDKSVRNRLKQRTLFD